MRRSNLSTILYLAVVFLSGVVVGGFALRLYTAKSVNAIASQNPAQRHAEIRKQYITDMRTRLRLTDAQVAQLEQIADATGQRMHEMHRTIDAEHVEKVNAMLNDDQRAEYAKWRDEREKRRQQDQSKK